MRRVLPLVGLGALLLVPACNHTRWGALNRSEPEPPAPKGPPPSVAALVDYLNANAKRIESLRCDELDLTCTVHQGLVPQSFSLRGKMICQQPKNFRLGAAVLGNDQVDLGSNDEEFWYWIKKGDNAQIHCSYRDLAAGNVKQMPFPFQPDWMLEALGMANYGPAERWQLVTEAEQVKLVEHTRSPQGKPVSKIIVIRRREMKVPAPQVTDFLLVDDTTKAVICSAHVSQSQQIAPTGGLVPRQVELNWPAQKLRLAMKLDTLTANLNIPPNSPAFVRRPLTGVPCYDLATGRIDGQPSSLQRAGHMQRPDVR